MEPPAQVAARLLSGAGSGEVRIAGNGSCVRPLPVLHGRSPQGMEWMVTDQTRLPGWEAVDHLRSFPVTFGVVEQAPLVDVCVTTASLVGMGTAQVLPPGQQLTVAPSRCDRPTLAEILQTWAEARVFRLCLQDLTVEGPFGRAKVDPDTVRRTRLDPFALDQLGVVERISASHEDLVATLARPWTDHPANPADPAGSDPAEQVRLIGVDRRGATALRVLGSTGIRVRIPFPQPVETIEAAIDALLELARADRA